MSVLRQLDDPSATALPDCLDAQIAVNEAMHVTFEQLQSLAAGKATQSGVSDPAETGWGTAWLEACGYGGVKLLTEALSEPFSTLRLDRDALGLDLHNVSCAAIGPAVARDVVKNGRAFLRNVRHGLFLLPFAVRENISIGCPIDPAFALGGERSKNPYAEKLALAHANGLDIDDSAWVAFAALAG
ncbi:hypothetical protein [Aestuariivirga sp.]|uniref:hypothetical protein n=1 Tax=Aestuariivirga sp. TaxID=2650926 RepID=UPI0039E6A930